MKSTALLYFTNMGYVLCDPRDGPTSLMTIDISDLSTEARLRRAWYYLGRGIADILQNGYEFVELYSDTKVIDQLDGVIIDDDDCIIMSKTIRTALTKRFVHYELRKVTNQAMIDKFNEARKELRGQKCADQPQQKSA